MEQQCAYCEEQIQQEQPKTELLCHHFFHTSCLFDSMQTLVNLHERELHQIHCVICNAFLFQQQEQNEDDTQSVVSNHSNETNESTRISNLYDTNEDFRNLIKKYHKSRRDTSKPKKAFMQVVATKKEELKNPYALIKAQVEGLYNVKKDDIMNSPEYKEFKKAEARNSRYYELLRNRYNIRSNQLYALRSKPGLKSLQRPSYWRNRPARTIRRALRLRLPWY